VNRLTWIVGAMILLIMMACTPREVQEWKKWHAVDPAAATAFARNLPQTSSQRGGWTLNWDAVARCESGGNWGHGPVSNRHGTFSGGLMIGHQYWDGYNGYAAPHHAPKHVQIAWAEDLIDGSYAAADRAWQCVGGPARGGA